MMSFREDRKFDLFDRRAFNQLVECMWDALGTHIDGKKESARLNS